MSEKLFINKMTHFYLILIVNTGMSFEQLPCIYFSSEIAHVTQNSSTILMSMKEPTGMEKSNS